MAAPKLKDVSLPNPSLLLLEFDTPLAQIATPLSSFTVNHGTIEVRTLIYTSNKIIALSLDTALNPNDAAFISYDPPLDINFCLRSTLPSDATDVDKKRHAVSGFSRVNARNLLLTNPEQDGSDINANLGQDDDNKGYPNSSRPSDPRSATVDDFVLAYGEKEAIQLSNIEDGSATSVNAARIRVAIEDANARIDNYIIQADKAGRKLISSNRRRTALMIARYYLDTVRRRSDVYQDYQDCIKELESAANDKGRDREGEPAIETKRGAIRIHRIPQRYNSVTGKGLSGWQTDMGAGEEDYRNENEGLYGNLSEGGSRSTGYSTQEPTDSGGVENP